MLIQIFQLKWRKNDFHSTCLFTQRVFCRRPSRNNILPNECEYLFLPCGSSHENVSFVQVSTEYRISSATRLYLPERCMTRSTKKMVTRTCFVTVLTIYEQASGQMNTLGWSCSGNTNQYICLLMWFGRNSNNSNNNKRKNKRKRIIIKNTSDVLCLFSYFN